MVLFIGIYKDIVLLINLLLLGCDNLSQTESLSLIITYIQYISSWEIFQSIILNEKIGFRGFCFIGSQKLKKIN